jgi:hypothetical protein
VKADDGYEKSLEHHRETAPRKKEKAKTTGIAKKKGGSSLLASGRRAGAGWERSAYVHIQLLTADMLSKNALSPVPLTDSTACTVYGGRP